MYTSSPPRNTIARKPSHFGSNRNAPSGMASASLASIGSMGASIANADVMTQRTARASFDQLHDAGVARAGQLMDHRANRFAIAQSVETRGFIRQRHEAEPRLEPRAE